MDRANVKTKINSLTLTLIGNTDGTGKLLFPSWSEEEGQCSQQGRKLIEKAAVREQEMDWGKTKITLCQCLQ